MPRFTQVIIRQCCYTAPQVVRDADLRNLVALATTRHVLLLDCRRPKEPLLQWAHGLDASPPTHIALHCLPGSPDPSQNPATGDPGLRSAAAAPAQWEMRHDRDNLGSGTAAALRGLVTVCNLASGDVLTFPFILTGAGDGRMRLAARHAAPAEALTRSQRRSALVHRFPGELTASAAIHGSVGSDGVGSKTADPDPGPPAFAWSPLLSAVYQAGLPWRVCRPLGRGKDDSPAALLSLRRDLRAAHDADNPLDLQVRV